MIRNRLIAATATAALAAAPLAVVAAQPASAATRPVLYNFARGWQHGRVKPHDIYVGARGPYVTSLKWSHWTSTAYGHGVLHLQSAACLASHPSDECAYGRHAIGVTLRRVRSHKGVAHFTRMRWSFQNAGKHALWYWREKTNGDFGRVVAAKLTCRASMSDSSPSQYSDDDVRVTTLASAHVRATAHYKTTSTSHSRTASSAGRAVVPFYISGASIGYTVDVDVSVTKGGRSASCATSFTPQ